MELSTKKLAQKRLLKTVIKKLESRDMEGFYLDSAKDAVELVKELVPPGSSVAFGGSETLKETGIMDVLKSGNYTVYDRANVRTPEEARQMYANHTLSDYYFMSTNAITYDGILVNIDGTGNRVACLIHGPENIIVVAGINKLSETIVSGIERTKNIAAPPNAIRLNRNTPCKDLGRCVECLNDDCICCNTVITRKSYKKGRIKVLLINDSFGY